LSGLGKAGEKVTDEIEKPGATEEAASASVGLPPKVYLKALPLRTLDDVNVVKREVKSGNILILKVSPLARKSVEDVKRAVSELYDFVQLIGGDIARLGEERVVLTPSFVRIWREKAVSPKERTPTAV